MFHHTTLSNGLEILAEIRPSAYSTAVGFFVRTGARDETPSVAGVSHFLEHMAFKGTDTRTADDVNRELDEMGASANAFTSEEQTVYYAVVLPELLEKTVDLFGDMMRPAIRRDDFETEKQVILEEIKMYEDQPPFGADEKSRELFFAGHPLGKSVLGTHESIAALSLEQMRAYHEARYTPENLFLVGCGRLDFDDFVRKAERSCGRWKPGNASPAFPRSLSKTSGRSGMHAIAKPSATQRYSLLLSNAPGADAGEKERLASILLACVLGDEVGSRLYWELIDNGKADSAWLGAYEYLDAGMYMTMLAGEPETAPANLEIVQRIYREAEKNGIMNEEFERARNKTLSRIVLANEQPRGRLFAVGGEWTVRKRYRTVRDDLDAVRGVALDDLHDVLARYPLTSPLLVSIGPEPGGPLIPAV
ncbi:MAG TPA: insulinase family protein [Planctomycetaceae bacterium]|nr:insulinase family protein [Planctomycetaceae bacterium]